MKLYLLLLLLLIMGTGAYTMFQIAHNALGREHDFAPDGETTHLIFITVGLLLLMIADVLLLNHRHIRYHQLLVLLLTAGVTAAVIYIF